MIQSLTRALILKCFFLFYSFKKHKLLAVCVTLHGTINPYLNYFVYKKYTYKLLITAFIKCNTLQKKTKLGNKKY